MKRVFLRLSVKICPSVDILNCIYRISIDVVILWTKMVNLSSQLKHLLTHFKNVSEYDTIRNYLYVLILHIPIECWILSLITIIDSWPYHSALSYNGNQASAFCSATSLPQLILIHQQ